MIFQMNHFFVETSEAFEGFNQWETQYNEFIENGGNVFEFERQESSAEVQPQENDGNNNALNIKEKLSTIRELNQFAIERGYQEMFIHTKKLIYELEKIRTDGSTLIHSTITHYFK